MKNSDNDKTKEGTKKYRPRLTPQAKAIIRKQVVVIMIYKFGGLTRADRHQMDSLYCDDAMDKLEKWLDEDVMMETKNGFIVGFDYIIQVKPDGEKLRLLMSNGMLAIVTKANKIEFKCRYRAYLKSKGLDTNIWAIRQSVFF
ncbi:MAG: hypothetical protein WCL06_08575 [Bacteroidota bacterium]